MNKNYIGFRKNVIVFIKSLFESAFPNFMGEEEDRNCEKSNRMLLLAKEKLEAALRFVDEVNAEKIMQQYFDEIHKTFEMILYNFNKVYPYALVGRKMMAQVDSTIAADVSKRSERTRYINDVEKELFRLFEKDIRNMTINQGLVLMRLVDRECGMSAFNIIKEYESGLAANFWQLVARIFSQNLKTRYDPTKGEDAKIEELCKIWDSGQWNPFYYSIFYEMPARVVIERESLETEVRKKSR